MNSKITLTRIMMTLIVGSLGVFGTLIAAPGCTDPTATNYDPLADEEDGSCLYLCDSDPGDLLTVTTNTAFDDGSGNSFGSAAAMGLLAGGNNVFGGHLWNVVTEGQIISEFCISIDYTVTGDPADFPRILEFRIENNGTLNWHHFNTEVPGPGSYTLGGIVSTGSVNGAGFDPDGASPALVAAIAYFPGDTTPLTADIIVEFNNLCVSTDCGDETLGCTDPEANNYNPDATLDDGSCLFNVTFNVNMNCFDGNDPNIELDGDGTFTTPAVEGPGFGWCGSCVPMEDPDMDGIWSVTVELGAGLFEYKYAHDGFAGQEQLVDDMVGGADCAPITDFAGFANRQVLVGPGVLTNDVYGSCDACNVVPINSLCDGAIAINEGIYTDAITAGTGGASNLCFGDDPAESAVWYEYTATATGLATVSSSIDADLPDTRVSVHTGTCAEPTCLVSDDDAGEGFTSIVEFPVIEGEVFLIEWDDRWGTDEFDFEVSVASGDDCPSPDAIICDNIDDYELGPMNGQGAHWSTWGGTLGGADDGIVTDEQAFSNANSVLIAEGQTQDVILLLGNQTTGTWDISWMEYVPADATAYYNIQEDEVPGVAWNLDVFFNQDGAAPGEGVITTTGSTFSYPEDAWFAVEMSLDLDNDLISVTIDGVAVDVDAPYAGSIGSINFFSIDATNRYYLDDLVWDGDSGFDPGSDCNNAIDISAGGMFSSAEVTGALEDFAGTCWTGTPLTANNWFFYTASADGILTVTSVDIGGTDTEVAAATGDCGALTEIACDEDFTGSAPWESEIAFPVIEGETYYIIWGNGWNGDPFDFEVSLDFPTEPCPDPGAVICDNFDDYALDMIAGQAAHWADWPGGSTSSMVSTEQAFSNTQSLNVAEGGAEDQLLLLGDQTTGVWTVDFMMYVPAGSNGYYNLQNTEATGQWNFDIFFNAGGAGDYQENQVSISPFTFPEDQWFEMSHTVDLNNLVVTIELDGAEVHTGPYIGDMVGCVNFYSIDATNNYFIDDVIVNGNPEVGVIEYTENAFTVYPNPTNSMLTISGEEQIDAVVLRDMLGAVVRQLDTPFSNQVTLDVADLSKGVYFVEVRVGDVVNVSRVIKN